MTPRKNIIPFKTYVYISHIIPLCDINDIDTSNNKVHLLNTILLSATKVCSCEYAYIFDTIILSKSDYSVRCILSIVTEIMLMITV